MLDELVVRLERDRGRKRAQIVLEQIRRCWLGRFHAFLPGSWWFASCLPARPTGRSLHAVASYLSEGLPHVRMAAACALIRAEPSGELTREPLLAAISDSFVPVRINALRALVHIDDVSATPALRGFLTDRNRQIRWLAARVLVSKVDDELVKTTLLDAARTDRIAFDDWIDGLAMFRPESSSMAKDVASIRSYIAAHPEELDDRRETWMRRRLESYWREQWRSAFADNLALQEAIDPIRTGLCELHDRLRRQSAVEQYLAYMERAGLGGK